MQLTHLVQELGKQQDPAGRGLWQAQLLCHADGTSQQIWATGAPAAGAPDFPVTFLVWPWQPLHSCFLTWWECLLCPS